jgi:glyoxylase-like metal-dependent hydrolase (beta-lactamase superfamily II)
MITVKTFIVNPVFENTYVLHDETREAVIIDCGCVTPAEEKLLLYYLSQEGLTVKRLLNTHLHFDHMLGNEYVSRQCGILPEAHRYEVEQVPPPQQQLRLHRSPFPVNFVDVGYYLNDNETIAFGHSELTALLTPGHSPGSLSFYSRKDGFILSGDVLFNGSIGRTDLWGGDFDTLITSIRERIFTLPDDTIVYPGHGDATTVGTEKQFNPYLAN